MANDKIQMPNEAQNPNEKEACLAFNLHDRAWQAGYLVLNCHLDFDIWVYLSLS
jgi:hypothetical protein